MTLSDELAKLAALRKSGDISDDDYRLATGKVISEYGRKGVSSAPPLPQTDLAPKKKRRFLLWAVLMVVALFGLMTLQFRASQQGREALRANDPAAYSELIASEERAAAEASRVEADRVSREQEAKAAKVAEAAENRRKGFHCLSPWDGSSSALVEWTKDNMKNPDSFRHDETRIAPVDPKGNHGVRMYYRGTNSFGGVVRGTVTGELRSSDCTLVSITSSD